MKKKIQIKYNSIFKYATHKESIQYTEIAIYEEIDKITCISFVGEGNQIKIKVSQDTIWLTNNSSILQLVKGKRIKNKYSTMYGNIYIDTFLESYENNGNIKIKYRLLDQEDCVGEVYIMIQMMEIENENS